MSHDDTKGDVIDSNFFTPEVAHIQPIAYRQCAYGERASGRALGGQGKPTNFNPKNVMKTATKRGQD